MSMHSFISIKDWQTQFAAEQQIEAVEALENGQILFFPQLAFALSDDEKKLLAPEHVDPRAKNISFNWQTNRIGGVMHLPQTEQQFKTLLQRFQQHATLLIQQLFPGYVQELIVARTSLRTVQISGRSISARKDDKRLHVDAFPSNPNQGKRILRVFCNINPAGEERVWRVGEAFEKVAQTFLPKIAAPLPGAAKILQCLKITKSYRTLYDHYMLQIHDRMKLDENYQATVPYTEIRFPAFSTWIVQTDHVSHAAMSGQHLLEQTFYLPVNAMSNPELSPLKILEKFTGCRLV